MPHSAVKVCLKRLLLVELQEKVAQNFLFRACTQLNEMMYDSKETSSARLVQATSHKNNSAIDFACAVKTHSYYVFLSFLIHTIDIYIWILTLFLHLFDLIWLTTSRITSAKRAHTLIL